MPVNCQALPGIADRHHIATLRKAYCSCLWCCLYCSGANAYFKDGSLHFYKDYATYEQHLDVYESKPDVLPYHPYYYYRQVRCTAWGQLSPWTQSASEAAVPTVGLVVTRARYTTPCVGCQEAE